MNKSFLISLFIVFSFSALFAQKSINSYKYILVPKQFEFQKLPDQYQLNSLTKFLFERAGFTVFYTDDTLPEDLAANRCLALKALVNNRSGMLNTKMNVELSDCYNNIVFSTKEGVTKEKDYKKAYQGALRITFVDIENLKYAYDGTLAADEKISKKKAEIEKLTVKEVLPVIEEKKVPEVSNVKEIPPMKVAKQIEKKEENEVNTEPVKSFVLPVVNSIEGKYFVDKWGECNISAKNGYYAFVGGDE
ncbi:MAG: hypothetical protein ACYC01_11055, partial [Lutibacter sp.]